MNNRQEEYFLCAFIWNLKMDRQQYIKWYEEETDRLNTFEEIERSYPGMSKVIRVVKDTLGIWKGKIDFYTKAIKYLEDIIEEKGLENLLDRNRNKRGK